MRLTLLFLLFAITVSAQPKSVRFADSVADDKILIRQLPADTAIVTILLTTGVVEATVVTPVYKLVYVPDNPSFEGQEFHGPPMYLVKGNLVTPLAIASKLTGILPWGYSPAINLLQLNRQ